MNTILVAWFDRDESRKKVNETQDTLIERLIREWKAGAES